MKNFLQQNHYLKIVSVILLVSQLYGTAIVKCQTIDLDMEYSYCSNWSENYSSILPLPPPQPPAPIVLETLIMNPILIGPAGQPGFPGQATIPGSNILVPLYITDYTNYNCPYYDTIIVKPNIDWKQSGLSVFLDPKETTEYIITYKVTKDPYCNNEYTMKVKVEVIEACSFSDDDIQNIQAEYPWIDDLENICINSIEVYKKNNTNYLLFNYPKYKRLYFQDGSRLCTDAPDYSCLEAYQVSNKVKTWLCNQPIDDTSSSNENSEQAVFNNYPWLTEKIDQSNCSNEIIHVYDADTYEFLVLKTDSGESMFNSNGDLICFSAAGGFSFIGLYDESRILNSWTCEQGFQGRESKPKKQDQDQDIQIFPNPANNKVFINIQKLAFEQSVISIYDVQGKEVLRTSSADAFAGIIQLDVGDLARGIYLVEVQTADTIITKKLLIN